MVKILMHSTQSWWIALYAFCGWAPVATFASLWGVPFIMQAYGISSTLAATTCAMIWIGLMVGSPLFGWYSSRVGKRLPILRYCALLGLIVSLLIIYFPGMPLGVMMVLLFGFGVAVAGHILTFALAKETHSPQVTATVIGFNNMAVVAGGAIFQPFGGTDAKVRLGWSNVGGDSPIFAGKLPMGLVRGAAVFFGGLGCESVSYPRKLNMCYNFNSPPTI